MIAKPARTIIALAITALLLAGCGQELSWRQKLTVEVETPEGVKTGSSVVRAEVYKNPEWAPGDVRGSLVTKAKGEAVYIEVTSGVYLFALLSDEATRALYTFRNDEQLRSGWDLYEKIEEMDASRAVPRKNWPRFVTFENINDPSSVQAVDKDDLAASFGPGYRVKSVTLQITNERMTSGNIKNLLTWLGEYPEPGLCPATGRGTNIPLCRRYHHGDFVRQSRGLLSWLD